MELEIELGLFPCHPNVPRQSKLRQRNDRQRGLVRDGTGIARLDPGLSRPYSYGTGPTHQEMAQLARAIPSFSVSLPYQVGQS